MATIDMSSKPVFPAKCIFDSDAGITGAALHKVDEVHQAVGNGLSIRMDQVYAKYGDTIVGASIRNTLGQVFVIESMYDTIFYKLLGVLMDNAAQFVNESFLLVSELENSMVAAAPFHVQVEELPVGTTLDLQGKVHPDASWVTIKSYSDADTPTVYVFGGDRFNFVRAVRNGVGDVKVFTQG